MVQQVFERNQKAKMWKEQKCVLTEYAHVMFNKEKAKMGRCNANHISSTDDLEELTVWDTYTPTIQFNVDIKQVRCECIVFDQIGIVCQHLMFAMQLCNHPFDAYKHFDSCYLVSTYHDAFRYNVIHFFNAY